MKRAAVLVFAIACGGAQNEGPKAATSATASVTVPPPVATAIVVAVDAGTPTPDALPPPKSTTIRLASTAGDAVDQELDKGDASFETGSFDDALVHYQAAHKAAPKRVGPAVGIARVKIAKSNAPLDYGAAKGNRDVMSAVRDLTSEMATEKDFGPGFAELGRAQLMLGDAAGALASLRRAVELLPQEAEAHSALGVALLATGDKNGALESLQRAANLDMGSAPRHGNLGTVFLLLGRVTDAVREYELQARIANGDARSHSDLGAALLAHDEVSRAVTELERAVQLDPKRPSYQTNLGYAYQLLGKRDEAIAKYREALKIDPQFASAWIDLATALAQDPKTRAEARQALLAAQKIDPTDPRVKSNLEELDALEHGTKAP